MTLLRLATLDFARLLVMTPIAEFLEGALFVEFLLQPTQSAVDDLAFLDADLGIHADSPPLSDFGIEIFHYYNTFLRGLQPEKRKNQMFFGMRAFNGPSSSAGTRSLPAPMPSEMFGEFLP